jgi:hypothetical protein
MGPVGVFIDAEIGPERGNRKREQAAAERYFEFIWGHE